LEEKSKKIESVDSVVVSSSVLANLFGITTRRIRQLEDDGVIEKASRGRYKLTENIQKYIIYIKASQELKKDNEDENKIDYDMEHALLERRRREKLDIEIAQIRGTMHKSEDVEKVMNDMLANCRSKLLALPSKVAPRLIAREDIGELQDILQIEILEALSELSNYEPSAFYSENYIESDELEEEKYYGQEDQGKNTE
jgi:phage terminase Nu1 subunit (DNA packaging protein)